jgi:hypothetical protein
MEIAPFTPYHIDNRLHPDVAIPKNLAGFQLSHLFASVSSYIAMGACIFSLAPCFKSTERKSSPDTTVPSSRLAPAGYIASVIGDCHLPILRNAQPCAAFAFEQASQRHPVL